MSQCAIAVHSNMKEVELSIRMQARGYNLTLRRIYFLGRSLAGTDLPLTWTVMTPIEMEEQHLREIVEDEGIIIIGTVKKIDDLRRRCKEFGLELRFAEILHDEFVRHKLLDFITIAKVADNPCRYHALGDGMSTEIYQ